MWLLLAILARAEPIDVLREEGCVACHDPADAAGVGPPLGGIAGRAVVVLRGPERVTTTADDAYLRRALTEPGADVVEGYSPGIMPAVTDPERVERVLAALRELPPARGVPRGSLGVVGVGAVGFVAGHLALSTRLARERIGAAVGANGFLGVYSLVVAAFFGVLLWGWSGAPYVELWPPLPWTRLAPLVVMPFVAIAQVAGYSTRTPTMSGQAATLAAAPTPRGIHRITRHPVNLSAAGWGLAHMLPNGDVANLLLMGSVVVLGVAGSLHIDRRLAAIWPDAWETYAAQTSFLPFVAILQGRTTLSLREIGVARIAGGLALFVVALLTHAWVIGRSPYP